MIYLLNMKNVEQLINDAIDAHKKGNHSLAEKKYNKALKTSPKNPKLLYFFGIFESQRNNNIHAEKLLEQCSKLVPNDADIEYNLGTVCQQLEKHKKAIKRFINAITSNPQLLLAHLNLGASYIQIKDYVEAIPPLEAALSLSTDNEDVLYNLAKAHYHLEHWQTSYEYGQKIPSTSKHFIDAIVLSAESLARDYKQEKSLEILKNALKMAIDSSIILNKMGDICFSQKNYDAALTHYIDATEKNKGNSDSYVNLGRLLYTTGNIDQALQWLRTGLEECADKKSIHSNYALILLADGKLGEGWNHYIHRIIDRPHSKLPPFEKLDSDLANQTIYLVPDQGIGDQLFFLRFIPLLQAQHAKVKICVHEKLKPALRTSNIHPLLIGMRQVPLKGEIYELGDLPYLLGCNDNDYALPLELKIDSNKRLVQSNRLPNIGISWRGGIADGKTLYKEINLTNFLETISAIQANWYILQRHPELEELEQVRSILGDNIQDASELNEDLESMLELLDQLDDQIGVSNTNVHLRSSLGKTGKVLIPNPPDWRWLIHVEESPWVPGYKIYRQSTSEDWSEPLSRLASDLKKQYT